MPIDRVTELGGTRNPRLTELATGYRVPNGVAHEICPILNVETQKGTYDKFGAEMLAADDDYRAEGATGQKLDINITEGDYAIHDHSRYVSIDRRYNATIIADRERYRRLKERRAGMLRYNMEFMREYIGATFLTAEATYSGNYRDLVSEGDTNFDVDNFEDTDPIDFFEDYAYDGIRAKTGLEPNAAWFSYDFWRVIKHHPKWASKVLGRSGEGKKATVEMVKDALGLDYLWVAKSLRNSTPMADTPTFVDLYSKAAGFLVWDPSAVEDPAMPAPAFARCLMKSGDPEVVDNIETAASAEEIHQFMMYGFEATMPGAGYLFDNLIS